ncbi:MAG: 50S ribosome-binding protein YggL [Desulfobacterales bacterium]
MKKRLRKKKRVGEFQEFGFRIGFRFSDELSRVDRNDLIDRFIEKAIEDNGLQFGGGGGKSEWDGFVALDKPRGSVSDHHRETVEQWFVQDDQILEYYVSPMIDAWYGESDKVENQWEKKQINADADFGYIDRNKDSINDDLK